MEINMKLKTYKLCLTLIMFSTIVVAQSGGDFLVKKSVIASGGGSSSGGSFSINGTIGQASASKETNGGNFSLTGGFWAQTNNDIIFKNGFE
jgi:hypothetical protein